MEYPENPFSIPSIEQAPPIPEEQEYQDFIEAEFWQMIGAEYTDTGSVMYRKKLLLHRLQKVGSLTLGYLRDAGIAYAQPNTHFLDFQNDRSTGTNK